MSYRDAKPMDHELYFTSILCLFCDASWYANRGARAIHNHAQTEGYCCIAPPPGWSEVNMDASFISNINSFYTIYRDENGCKRWDSTDKVKESDCISADSLVALTTSCGTRSKEGQS